jgi:hypothetical protein
MIVHRLDNWMIVLELIDIILLTMGIAYWVWLIRYIRKK